VKQDAENALDSAEAPFSILKRIVMGETNGGEGSVITSEAFSILKRIVMGETRRRTLEQRPIELSVSSSGS